MEVSCTDGSHGSPTDLNVLTSSLEEGTGIKDKPDCDTDIFSETANVLRKIVDHVHNRSITCASKVTSTDSKVHYDCFEKFIEVTDKCKVETNSTPEVKEKVKVIRWKQQLGVPVTENSATTRDSADVGETNSTPEVKEKVKVIRWKPQLGVPETESSATTRDGVDVVETNSTPEVKEKVKVIRWKPQLHVGVPVTESSATTRDSADVVETNSTPEVKEKVKVIRLKTQLGVPVTESSATTRDSADRNGNEDDKCEVVNNKTGKVIIVPVVSPPGNIVRNIQKQSVETKSTKRVGRSKSACSVIDKLFQAAQKGDKDDFRKILYSNYDNIVNDYIDKADSDANAKEIAYERILASSKEIQYDDLFEPSCEKPNGPIFGAKLSDDKLPEENSKLTVSNQEVVSCEAKENKSINTGNEDKSGNVNRNIKGDLDFKEITRDVASKTVHANTETVTKPSFEHSVASVNSVEAGKLYAERNKILSIRLFKNISKVKPEINTDDDITGSELEESFSQSELSADELVSVAKLKEHSSSTKRVYSCEHCTKKYGQFIHLRTHQNLYHADKDKYTCEACKGVFDTLSKLKKHEEDHVDIERRFCEICLKTYSSKSAIKRHLGTVHVVEKQRPHQCDICDFAFTCRWHLQEHLRIHAGKRDYACPVCGRAFNHVGSMNRHAKDQHNYDTSTKQNIIPLSVLPSLPQGPIQDTHFTIPVLKTPSESDLSSDELKPNIEQNLELSEQSQDEAIEIDIDSSDNTSDVVNEFRPLLIAELGDTASTDNTNNRVNHIRPQVGAEFEDTASSDNSSDTGKYTCQYCNNQFKQLHQLRHHQSQVHTNEENFICGACTKVFASFEELKGHEITHVRFDTLYCELCKRQYSSRSAVKRHIYACHSLEKRKSFHCGVCGKSFVFSWNLQEHMKIHQKDFSLYCPVCEKGFRRPGVLKVHAKDIHNIDLSNIDFNNSPKKRAIYAPVQFPFKKIKIEKETEDIEVEAVLPGTSENNQEPVSEQNPEPGVEQIAIKEESVDPDYPSV